MKSIISVIGSLILSSCVYCQTKAISISADSSSLSLYQSGKIPIPKWILSCNKIKEINLSNQPHLYEAINQLASMDGIRSMIIQNAGMENLPFNIYKIKGLKLLDLRGNYLQTLPYSIRYCYTLESIDLGSNKMKRHGIVDILKSVSKLRWLNLGNNGLESIPSEVCAANRLAFLYISDNKIKLLPECIYSMQSLIQLGLRSSWTDRRSPLPNPIDVEMVKAEFSKNGLKVMIE